MPSLTIEDLPDDLYERLRARAERENRSIAEEVAHRWRDEDSTTYLDNERNSWG